MARHTPPPCTYCDQGSRGYIRDVGYVCFRHISERAPLTARQRALVASRRHAARLTEQLDTEAGR